MYAEFSVAGIRELMEFLAIFFLFFGTHLLINVYACNLACHSPVVGICYVANT